MPSKWPPLWDAAGNEVSVDECRCERPKRTGDARCCATCSGFLGVHGTSCHLRCATLGVPGFTLAASGATALETAHVMVTRPERYDGDNATRVRPRSHIHSPSSR